MLESVSQFACRNHASHFESIFCSVTHTLFALKRRTLLPLLIGGVSAAGFRRKLGPHSLCIIPRCRYGQYNCKVRLSRVYSLFVFFHFSLVDVLPLSVIFSLGNTMAGFWRALNDFPWVFRAVNYIFPTKYAGLIAAVNEFQGETFTCPGDQALSGAVASSEIVYLSVFFFFLHRWFLSDT